MFSPDIVVKKSKIHGLGVFAGRNFQKGEVVLAWDVGHRVSKSQAQKMTKKMRSYLNRDVNGKLVLLQAPERFVNHSPKANTKVSKARDVAIRFIKKGEEITGNYDFEEV